MTNEFKASPWKSGLSMDILLTGDVRLASPPEIFLKISQILDDPTKTARDAEQVIRHDPGLTARLLRLVNSAFYGFPRQISSISHAITIVGARELRDLVLATVVVERFGRLPNKLMTMRAFWRVSVRSALLAREMGKCHAQSSSLRSVFVCGLLHEIGRLVIYAKIPELARAAILLAEGGMLEETEAERQIYGFDHYQLAYELARRWHLPEVITATLQWHEHPEEAGDFSRETALVALACRLSLAEIETPQQLEQMPPTWGRLLDLLRLKRDVLSRSMEEADSHLQTVFGTLFQS